MSGGRRKKFEIPQTDLEKRTNYFITWAATLDMEKKGKLFMGMICIPIFPRKKLSKQYKAAEQDMTSGEFSKTSVDIALTKLFKQMFENDKAQICYCKITEEKRPKE